jgi:hypothetical protein
LPLSHDAAEGTKAPARFPQLNGLEKQSLFTEIGVRTILNARGTYTIITGSRSLPEVKRAMYEASFYYVQLDELMAAVGKEIASLMGAPSAVVTTGCEAAIALAPLACTAGAAIEKCQALPYVRQKTKVIIPKHSRNPYDFGVRTTGAEVVEVETAEQLEDSLTAQVAMVYVMSSPETAKGPLSIANICRIAKAKGTPVFVDAAAEEPLSPNIHIQAGASRWAIQEASVCAARRPLASFWAILRSFRRHGFRLRLTITTDVARRLFRFCLQPEGASCRASSAIPSTRLRGRVCTTPARTRWEKKRSWGCWPLRVFSAAPRGLRNAGANANS